jgi:hypothetical protein
MTTKTAVKTNGAISPDELRQAIQADREQRVRACMAKIQDALDEYRCDLFSVAYLSDDGRTLARTDIRARD